MQTHVKVLAVLHIVFGAMGIFFALGMLLFFGGMAGLVAMSESAMETALAAPILGALGAMLFLAVLAMSLPGVIAGIGLLKFRNWARILTILISVVLLFHVPFGTALGVYGFWVLFSRDGALLFEPSAVSGAR